MNKTDLQAFYPSGTYCQKTGTRPPSCSKPRQPTIYVTGFPYEITNLVIDSKNNYLWLCVMCGFNFFVYVSGMNYSIRLCTLGSQKMMFSRSAKPHVRNHLN